MNSIRFGIIGSGWRAECFLQVARLLPDRFEICGLVSRRAEKRVELAQKWGIPVFASSTELLTTRPDFVVAAVAKEAGAAVIKAMVAQGVPILAETPPANDLAGLVDLYRSVGPQAKVQIAEQYFLQPMHQARLAVAHSGKFGAIHYAHVSISQGYHAISLMRKALGVGFENPTIQATTFEMPGIEGPGRAGLPEREQIVRNPHTLAVLNYASKVGLFDFEKNQHRSWARSQRFLIRGIRGEVNHDTVKYLADYRTPIQFELLRQHAGEDGNLEGYHLKGILGGTEWVYQNPFAPARLSDEEIALAASLMRMKQYTIDGTELYSLAEACQDQYLALLIDQACERGLTLQAVSQIWAHSEDLR